MQIKREKGMYTKLLPMITLGEKSWIADPFTQYGRTLWGPKDQQTCFPFSSGSGAGSIFRRSIPLTPSQTPSFLLFFPLFPEEVSLGLLVEVEKNGREDGGWRRKLTPITLAPGPVLEQCPPSAPLPLGQLLPAHWIESESVLVAFKAPVSSLPLGSPHSPAPHALTSLLLESPSTLGLSPLVCRGSMRALMPVSLECRDFNFSPPQMLTDPAMRSMCLVTIRLSPFMKYWFKSLFHFYWVVCLHYWVVEVLILWIWGLCQIPVL